MNCKSIKYTVNKSYNKTLSQTSHKRQPKMWGLNGRLWEVITNENRATVSGLYSSLKRSRQNTYFLEDELLQASFKLCVYL